MTKRDLVMRISKETGIIQQDVFAVIQKTLDYITESLVKGDTIEFRDFGVFETRTRASRVAQNPKTLQRVDVPAKRTVKFKMGRLMKDKMGAGIRESATK